MFALIVLGRALAVTPVLFLQELGSAAEELVAEVKVMSAHFGDGQRLPEQDRHGG